MTQSGYRPEGIAGYVYPTKQPFATKWHRYFDHQKRDHFYTVYFQDLGADKPSEYMHEGFEGYVFPPKK